MAAFHILHVMPGDRLHIFAGYQEVIDTVVWGLRSLGHETTCAVNRRRLGATNIVFGAQLLDDTLLNLLPDGSIIYNLEQIPGLMSTGRRMDEFRHMARRFVIWDYNRDNLDLWSGEFGAQRACHVPVGFAPVLCRIPKPAEQDIDVLIYGAPSDTRMSVLKGVCALGLSTMFVYGLYGEARDALIARSKLVLNITSNPQSSIFSIVRVSYLLANRKAVIADIASIEQDVVHAVKFTHLDDMAQCCGHFILHPPLREILEEQGFRTFQQRDVRRILAAALLD